MNNAPNIRLGVVIPAYGHPKFLSEAIISACEQETEHSVSVVVVDDGCRFQETADTVNALMHKYRGMLFYVRQENTRLPGARNAGIRFLLNIEPELDAIFFLDADNRLSPYSLQAFWNTLEANPDKAWAYPDINFFGLVNHQDGFETRETARQYSKLKHLVSNVSEAGSMVRSSVFKAGVFFDETMTSGFEDWEFWLSALEAGFQGIHAPHAGFMYRVRPESMLSESQREVDGLVQKIRKKHAKLYAPSNILQWEQAEAPAFAIYVPGEQSILLTSDLLSGGEVISLDDFTKRFHDWAYNYHEYFFPTHVMVMSRAVLDMLKETSVFSRWLMWRLRECENIKQCVQFVCDDQIIFDFLPFGHEDLDAKADIFCVQTQLLWERAHDREAHKRIERSPYWATVSLPYQSLSLDKANNRDTQSPLEDSFEALTDQLLPMPEFATHAAKMFSGPHAQTVRQILIPELCAAEDRQPFPVCTDASRTLIVIDAVLLNEAGAYQGLLEILKTISASDHERILLLENINTWQLNVGLLEKLSEHVTTIVPLNVPKGDLGHAVYLGGAFEKKLGKDIFNDAAIIARTCDTIISLGVTAGIEIFGDAKRHGAKGYVSLKPEFMAGTDLEINKLLAYEHAVAGVQDASNAIRTRLVAGGFPAEKITLDNALASSEVA